MSDKTPIAFDAWVQQVFTAPDEAGELSPADLAVEYISRLFESSGELAARFSPDQLAAGLHYFASTGESAYMYELGNASIPAEARLRCIRSIPIVFENVVCRLLPGDRGRLTAVAPAMKSLADASFMWWDVFPGRFDEKWIEDALIGSMEAILALPSEACQQSALHGLAHRELHDPPRVHAIIDAYLARTPVVDPDLRQYALDARTGNVL